LDALGGCLALLGRKPEADAFWALAAHVDVRGPHRLGEAGASEGDLARLHAFWAWSAENRVFPPRDGTVADITEAVEAAGEALGRILGGDPGQRPRLGRRRARVRIAPPIAVQELLPTYRTERRAAVAALTADLQTTLQGLIVPSAGPDASRAR
jgi:hypothetical protein